MLITEWLPVVRDSTVYFTLMALLCMVSCITVEVAQYSFHMASLWNFHGLKQANYHHKALSISRNLWSYLFSTLYNKRELSEMHVGRVPNLALLSEYSLRAWCIVAVFLLDTVCLITYHFVELLFLWSYFSCKVFSLHDNSTHNTWRFETSFFFFNSPLLGGGNRLLHN